MDFERVKKRYAEFWAKENTTPILLLKGSKGEVQLPTPPQTKQDRWCDTDYVVKKERAILDNTFFKGDAYPLICPNLGPDVFGASLGAEIVFEETTSYSVPFVKEWTEDISFYETNKWWKKIKEITTAFVEDSKGDYIVGITDIHAGADGLVSIRGPQDLCFDVFDQPQVFLNSSKILLPAFKKQFEELYQITQKYQKGTSNWMSLYKDEPWYVTSSDFIGMISNDSMQELILPELLEEVDYLQGNTIFHLDGPGALKHLETLLDIPNLAGIQWVYGAGQPSARYWLDVLKKIQGAGKCINIGLQRDDIDVVFSELNPQGLSCYFDFEYSKEEAEDILARAEKLCRR